jgi:hypothetical protein
MGHPSREAGFVLWFNFVASTKLPELGSGDIVEPVAGNTMPLPVFIICGKTYRFQEHTNDDR